MAQILFEAELPGPAEAIFDTIVDLRGYDRWMPKSPEFTGTTEISTDEVTVGTTYVERGKGGVRHGTVTELDRPARVTFHQPMTMSPRLLGVIDIHVTYTLTPTGSNVHVARSVTLGFGWPLRLLQPIVLRQFRAANQDTMNALVEHVRAR
jgi:uncharacterized protein YndB with AHSA1/START domain